MPNRVRQVLHRHDWTCNVCGAHAPAGPHGDRPSRRPRLRTRRTNRPKPAMRKHRAIAARSRYAEAAERRTGSPVQHGAARIGLLHGERDRNYWRGAHALQQEVDMKREDMGRTVLPPSRPTRNPRIEKISRPRRSFPESRFSQAGKASEGTPRWIRGFPRLPPSPAMSPMGADSRRHRRARDRAPAEEADSGRFAPSATLRPRATASTGRRLKTSPDPRSILPAQRGKCRRPSTPLPAAKGNLTRPRRPSMPIRQRLPRPAPATAVDMPAGARQILDRVS